MTDWKKVQARLALAPDGIPGPNTWGALFAHAGLQVAAGGVRRALGIGATVHLDGISGDPMELAHFLGQAAHETCGFRHLHEIWGPTDAQVRYEGRKDLGNAFKGDGFLFRGRGIFQLTGRSNYRRYGRLIGFNLEDEPELAANPAMSVLIAARYWRDRGIGPLARADDVKGVTRKINGGLNGLAERQRLTDRMKAVLLWSAPSEKITDRAVLLVIAGGLILIIGAIIVGIFTSPRALPNWAENVLVSIGTAAILKLGDCLATLVNLSSGRSVERLGTQLATSAPLTETPQPVTAVNPPSDPVPVEGKP